MSNVRIGILRGGPSLEHEASLQSGNYFLKNLEGSSDIFIDKEGTWHVSGIPKSPIDALQHFDVVINSLHGRYGEDGEVSKILDQSGVPYVGNPAYPSAATFDKVLFKKNLTDLGIKTPIYRKFNLGIGDDLYVVARDLFNTFPLPAVVKPTFSGSSIGVGVATSFETLVRALREAILISNDVLVEEYISGHEIVSGFVEDFRGQNTYILLPILVSVPEKKSAFVNKKLWAGHLDTLTRQTGEYEVELARGLSDLHKKEIENAIKKVKEHLGMRHYSTFDFIVSPKRGVYLIEADTSPHLGDKSPMITALKEVGVKVGDFFRHLIEKASI